VWSGRAHVNRDLVIVVGLLSMACAGHSTASLPEAPMISETISPVTGCAAPAGSSTYSVITAAELQWTRASNLYDAIRRLRPAYFESRGPSSIYNEPAADIVVIVNRHVIGGVDELRSMDMTDLVCVRRISAADVSLITGTMSSAVGIELVH
jgi:hypothetical protein